jgi:hypothetical protein
VGSPAIRAAFGDLVGETAEQRRDLRRRELGAAERDDSARPMTPIYWISKSTVEPDPLGVRSRDHPLEAAGIDGSDAARPPVGA